MIKVVDSTYRQILFYSGRCYGYTGLFKNEDITDYIKHVALIETSADIGNRLIASNNVLTGAVLSGVVGAIVSACSVRKYIEIYCIIYLTDGSEHRIITNDKPFIEFLIPHMHVEKKRRR